MKYISLILILLGSLQINAASLVIQDPCTKEEFLVHQQPQAFNANLGRTSLDIFSQYGIPHFGEEYGINSLFDTPVGDATLEVLSDTDMRAWGWCFAVNGEMINLMANLVELTGPEDEILWYYSYSYSHKNEWLNMCPFDLETVPPFCYE